MHVSSRIIPYIFQEWETMRGLEGFSAQRTRMKLAFLFATLALSTALPARAGITRDVSRPPPSVALPFDHVAFHGVRLSKEELDSLIGAPEACR